MMKIEYAIGHSNGSVTGPFPTEEMMKSYIVRYPGEQLARIITPKRTGFYKHLDPVNGLCYAPPIYKKLPEYTK
jgi:hypothetical protein